MLGPIQCITTLAAVAITLLSQPSWGPALPTNMPTEVTAGPHKQPGKLKWKNSVLKSMGHSKNSSKGEVCSDKDLSQETSTKSQMNNLTLHLKELEKEENQSPKLVEERKYSDQSRIK